MGCVSTKEAPGVVQVEEGNKDGDIPTSGAARTNNTFANTNASISVVNPKVALLRLWTRSNLDELVKKTDEVLEKGAFHLKNIFAVPFDLATYRPPTFSKTHEEKVFIEETLKQNFVFGGLSHREFAPLVQAFEKTNVDAGTVLMEEGDEGGYAYIIQSGVVEFTIKGTVVGEPASTGALFGELALLYTCPRAATATAKEDTCIFRVDQKAFRYVLQDQTKKREERKNQLLQGVEFLKGLSTFQLSKLAANMTPFPFKKDNVLGRKGDEVEYFWLIDEGELKVQDIGSHEDYVVGPGGHVGEHAIAAGERRRADFVALTDGHAFRIDRDTFKTALGDINRLIMEAIDKQTLSAIKLIRDTKLDPLVIKALVTFVQEATFKAGEFVLKEGEQTEAAFYLVHEGKLELMSAGGHKETLEVYSHFGEEMMLIDATSGKNGPSDPTTVNAPYTVQVGQEADCKVGILTLEDCRKVFQTIYLGKAQDKIRDSLIDRKFTLEELEMHRIIGAGTFGQVWVVSRLSSAGQRRVYALKVQSKYELCRNGQARAVVNEKNIMAEFRNPLLPELFGTFQDEGYIYMLMGLQLGGELERVIRTAGKLKEDDARFYAACIHEALSHMHHRGVIYRDLKPTNILIKSNGYPMLIDFGFAKYVFDKTFTLCGTPLYLAPEIISNRGHNAGVDHWSLGILTYEMLAGHTPFYREGMDQMELFAAITRCEYDLPDGISDNAQSFLKQLIRREPTKRLGSLAGGFFDIYRHPWFKSLKGGFRELRRFAIVPPYIPEIKDPLDTSNFQDWSHLEDKLKTKYKPISSIQKVAFEDF